MAAQREPSRSERVKNFLWFSGIAILIALAIVLWIRKARTPAKSELEQSSQMAGQQRAIRLLGQLQEALQQMRDTDPQKQRAGLTQIEQLLQQNPNFVPAKQALVRGALLLKDIALAERQARELAREFPDAVEAHRLLGLVALEAHRFPDAEQEIKKAIELSQKAQGAGAGAGAGAGEPQWDLHALLAEVYLEEGKTREADAELRRAADINLPQTAIQIARSSLALSERLGIVLLTSGKVQELEPAYRLLVGVAQHKKDDAEAQYLAAVAALRVSNLDEARTFLAAAEKLKPGDPRFEKLREAIARVPATTHAASVTASRATTTTSAPVR
jgi:tetratricopeptide (TPR) repeat protein